MYVFSYVNTMLADLRGILYNICVLKKIQTYGYDMIFLLNKFILGSMNDSFFITIAIFIFSTLVN